MNFGLMLISPVVLVRFLTVEQFGTYREFLLYGTLLTQFAAFNINNSLMYFVPAHPQSTWRFVFQSTVLVGVTSLTVVGITVIADLITGGSVVGTHLWALAAYTLLYVNIDFWEYLWFSQRLPQRVLVYTVLRMALRLAVVVVAALLTRDVTTIIWSLVAFEALRLIVSLIAWRLTGGPLGVPHAGSWREQIRSTLPLGFSLVLSTTIRNIGNLFVTRLLGATALAHYTVGTYVAPIVIVLRNSISDALLPAMSARDSKSPAQVLDLWQRSTVVFTILLLPMAVLLARFAEPIIVTLFSREYVEAVPVFQAYALLLIRECVDFGVLIRAMNQNRLLVTANIVALVVNLVLLPVLVVRFGLLGAVGALLVSRFIEGAWQLWQVASLCQQPMGRLLPWASMGRVAVAALLAGAGLLGWRSDNLLVVIAASAGYLVLFAALVWLIRVPEARVIVQRLMARRA